MKRNQSCKHCLDRNYYIVGMDCKIAVIVEMLSDQSFVLVGDHKESHVDELYCVD